MTRELEGRLGNVAGAVLRADAAAEAADAATSLLSKICEDVLVVGATTAPASGRSVPAEDASFLGMLVAGLAAARADRLLVVDAAAGCPSAELVLALTAWPETDAVVADAGVDGAPACAIYRREPVLAVARARLAAGETDVRGVLGEIEVSEIAADDLAALIAVG
jgi:molybdopterin-guanine dinucleotide biosynthesis protein A